LISRDRRGREVDLSTNDDVAAAAWTLRALSRHALRRENNVALQELGSLSHSWHVVATDLNLYGIQRENSVSNAWGKSTTRCHVLAHHTDGGLYATVRRVLPIACLIEHDAIAHPGGNGRNEGGADRSNDHEKGNSKDQRRASLAVQSPDSLDAH
jgi:hypothetical protein